VLKSDALYQQLAWLALCACILHGSANAWRAHAHAFFFFVVVFSSSLSFPVALSTSTGTWSGP